MTSSSLVKLPFAPGSAEMPGRSKRGEGGRIRGDLGSAAWFQLVFRENEPAGVDATVKGGANLPVWALRPSRD